MYDVYKAQGQLSQAAADAFVRAGLPEQLHHLVLMRVSQLNGCAFCIDMHSKDASKLEGQSQ